VKHEVLTRAIGELDDELIADAYAYKPRKRYALPRFLAAAACLVLVLAAALAMTRDTLPAEIKVEGAALSSIPIPISQPAAMALDARGSLSGPLSPLLTIESKSGEAVTVTVSRPRPVSPPNRLAPNSVSAQIQPTASARNRQETSRDPARRLRCFMRFFMRFLLIVPDFHGFVKCFGRKFRKVVDVAYCKEAKKDI